MVEPKDLEPAGERALETIRSASGVTFEVVEHPRLKGSDNLSQAYQLYFAQEAGARLRQLKITLNNSEVFVEAGALQYMLGVLSVDNPLGGVGGFMRKKVRQALTGETITMPRYKGSGELYLEPTFAHFALLELTDEELVTDKGLFYAAESGLSVGVASQKNISSALLGGEGLFQTKLAGTGTCALALPVPLDEIKRVRLNGEKLSVDGNFALLRRGKIDFKVEKSSKSIMGTLASGEGLLQTFQGYGEVWLAPTQSVYQALSNGGFGRLGSSQHGRGANVDSGEASKRSFWSFKLPDIF